VDTVEAVATDTVEVTLEDALADIDGEDFKFIVSGSSTAYYFEDDFGLDYDEDEDGNTILIFEFFDINDVMNYSAKDRTSNSAIYFVVMDNGSENQYGEPVEVVTQEVMDAIQPEIVVFDDGDDEYDVVFNYMTTYGAFAMGSEETTFSVIDIFFEEAIDPMSVSLDTFEVGGGDYEVLAIYVEGILKDVGTDMTTYGYITLIVENEDADDLEGVQIDQQSAIRDLIGNTTTGIETEIVDIEAVMPWLEDFAPPS
jgi:hypothetical protein